MSVNFYTGNGYGQYPQVQQDIKNVQGKVATVDSVDQNVEKMLISAVPTFRRTSSLNDKLNNNDLFAAAGLVGLTAINAPEDWRDMKSSAKQLGCILKGEKFEGSYKYSEVQHPFSFFRGTLLHRFVDPNTAKNKKLAEKLLNADITMADSSFGQKILKFLNTKIVGMAKTKVKHIGHTEQNPRFVKAKVYEGNAFGKLTARAMNRVTLIGTAALALLELPKIFKAMGEGENIAEQTGNTAKQTVKSGINMAAITAGIAYGGAIGSKYLGPTGSLIGMGVGAIFGSLTSKKVQEVIS